MIASFLITFREVIEATLIVATILGVLVRLHMRRGIRTVWSATAAAIILSILLLAAGSALGVRVRELYSGKTEELIEGILMIVSSGFITWAVFFLHTYFARYKTHLLGKIRDTVDRNEQRSLFLLTFTAILREGFEIVLFLTTMFVASDPAAIFTGFSLGAAAGILVSFGFFTAAVRLPVHSAFRVSETLLILFAAGLAARGIHEFIEAGVLPELYAVTLPFLPAPKTVPGDIITSVFGLTRSMDIAQIAVYGAYIGVMVWRLRLFARRSKAPTLATDH